MPPAAARARGRSLDVAPRLLEGARRGRAALGRFAGALLPSGLRRRTEVQQLHLALDDVVPAAVHVEVDEDRPSFDFQPSYVDEDEDRPSFDFQPSQVDDDEGRPSFGFQPSHVDEDGDRPSFDFQPSHVDEDEDRPSFGFQPSQVDDDEGRPSFGFQPSHVDEDRPSFDFQPSHVDEDRPSFLGSLSDADDDRPSFPCRRSNMAKNWRTFGDGGCGPQERPGLGFQPSHVEEDRPSFLGSLSDADDDRPSFKCGLSHTAQSRHTFGDGGSAPQGTDDSWEFVQFWERIEDFEEREIRQCVHRQREASRLRERTRGTM